MRLTTPLEQFEIHILASFSFFKFFDLSITTITVYSFLVLIFASIFLFFGVYNATLIPNYWQSVIELMYKFVFDTLNQQAGLKGQKFFPIFFSTFIFIMFANLIGLLPFGVTVTAQIIVTFALAFSFNLGFFFLGLIYHRLKFFNLFVPSDAPSALVPLIVVIEIVSYAIRTFSLSLRLFANMMAGHTLLHILSSFIIKFWQGGLYLIAIFPFGLVLIITVLEFGIAFLQAYVFMILLCIYLNDSLHPGH